MKEVWAPIQGFAGIYDVSSHGRVRAIARLVPNGGTGRWTEAKVLRQYKHTSGYMAIKLSVGMKRHSEYVHRLVCRAFCGAPKIDHEVLHRDGNKTNNRASNLRWGTRVENMADNAGLGIKPIGERHGRSKLAEADVRAIRSDPREHADIAKDFAVSRSLVSMIKRRDIWCHI